MAFSTAGYAKGHKRHAAPAKKPVVLQALPKAVAPPPMAQQRRVAYAEQATDDEVPGQRIKKH